MRSAWTSRTLGTAAAAVLGLVLLPATPAFSQATCNGLINIVYTSAPGVNFLQPGDVATVTLQIGTGSIQNGTEMTVQHLRFDLHCNSGFPLVVGCTEEVGDVEYQGDSTITTTCPGITWTSGHAVAAEPDEIVFTPNTPLVIPPNQAVPPGFCTLSFQVKVLSIGNDPDPTLIEEVVGYTGSDAACDNHLLVSGGFQTADLPLCPVCTGTDCTTSVCNQTTGMCVPGNVADSTPCPDTDGNACTSSGCEAGTCVQTHMVHVCPPSTNECQTAAACDPATGACNLANVPDSTPCTDTDANACTTAGCEAGTCVQTHVVTTCPPSANECLTNPGCNPATGACDHPSVADSTPCTDTDANACTTAGCEAGTCVQTHVVTTCPPSSNECLANPGCDPTTGMCPHPPLADSTPCTDTDANACTTAGCEAGTCVQTHVTTVCPPSPNECLENPGCDPTNGTCPHPPVPDSTPCTDTDNISCTTAGCEMANCIQAHISTCNLATRTVGFWKNHAQLTESIVSSMPLTICGDLINNTDINNAHSALEAMCGPANTNFEFQCCRQLMAAALNGAAGGASFSQLAACNTVCGDPTSSAADVQACASAADTFNGSGDNLAFPPGSPGSVSGPARPGACQAAGKTACLIVEPQRASCAVQ